MKIRQKIAMLLATAMVVTAVPAVTMAKSENDLTRGIAVVEDDKVLKNEGVTDLDLKIKLKDDATSESAFYVNLGNAKWKAAPNLTGNLASFVTATKNSDTEVKIKFNSDVLAGDDLLKIDLTNVEVTGGDATVSIDSNGTAVSDLPPVIFARTADTKATVTVGDATNLYDEGKVATITVLEGVKGQLVSGTTDDKNRVKLTINHPDYKFVTGKGKAEFTRGFAGISTIALSSATDDDVTGLTGRFFVDKADNQVAYLYLPVGMNVDSTGRIEFKDLYIKSTEKSPSEGSVEITVEGNKVTETTVKAANVAEYGTKVSVKDDKIVGITAGTKEKVTLIIQETAQDSFIGGKTVSVKFDGAYLATGNKKATNKLPVKFDGDIKLNDETINNLKADSGTQYLYDEDNYIVGFEFTMPERNDINAASPVDTKLKNDKTNKITFNDIFVYGALNGSGEVKVTVDGRGVNKAAVETVVAEVKAPVELKIAEKAELKVGLKNQKAGKLVITETDKGKIDKDQLVIGIEDIALSADSAHLPSVKVTEGNIIIESWKINNNGDLVIDVKRKSTQASTIEIEGFVMTTTRSIPQGTYEVYVTGAALHGNKEDSSNQDNRVFIDSSNQKDEDLNYIVQKDFVVIAQANLDDQQLSNGLKKGVANFVIGSDKYIVNGEEKTMDAKAYLDPAGRTMVPLRFACNALGVDDANIYYANKTATVVAGSKTISVKLGDKVAYLNGVGIRTMDVAPVMVESRVYVPVGELAALLSVEATWDRETQTATFTNK